MRMLIFTPKEKKLKLAVRAAKLHEALEANGVKIVKLPDFDFRKPSASTIANYLKLLFFIITKKKDDVVLFENERNANLLNLFKKLSFRIAIDIRDNRALQRQAYGVDDSPEVVAEIQKNLLDNIRVTNSVFVVSKSCKELYPSEYHNKIFVIENASDPKLFEFSPLPQELRVGFITGIAPGRGIEILIDAMNIVRRSLPQVKLSVACTPQKATMDYYNELKKRHESDRLSFHDDVFYSTNAKDFFKACYLTVIPHPHHVYYHTTLPVKLFDSLACGRPVVSTNCKETAKILLDYRCGVVADFNAESLAEKIIQLLANRDEASEMGKNGRRLIEEIYNWDNMAKKIIKAVSEGS